MSDPTAPVEGTPEPAAPEAATQAADPYAPVLDRVNELAANIDGRFAALEQRFQPEPEPEQDPWAALFPEQEEDPYAQPEPQGLDPQALQAAFQQALQQATAPMQQQMQEMQWARDREQLLSEIPQLKDPAVAAQVEQNFNAFLQQAGAPPQVAQWLVNSPHAIGNFFKAAEAQKHAESQVAASDAVPAVEAAGGAVPGGDGTQPSYVNQAMQGAWSLPPGLR